MDGLLDANLAGNDGFQAWQPPVGGADCSQGTPCWSVEPEAPDSLVSDQQPVPSRHSMSGRQIRRPPRFAD